MADFVNSPQLISFVIVGNKYYSLFLVFLKKIDFSLISYRSVPELLTWTELPLMAMRFA